MKAARVCSVLAFGAALAGFAYMYSGLADVAATSPHWALTGWVLSTTMDRSVRRHARGIEPPAGFDAEEHVREGAEAYDAMCASCHGAPGVGRGVVGQGLEPRPPDLSEEADDWSPAEIFWITENGVRMTGMPGFGPTHSADELWDLVAFVKRLPQMSAAEYRALAPARADDEHRHHHHHSTDP